MTFSIVGFDPKTQELGVAVASKFLSVGAVVPFAKAGVGAIATQSWANLDYGTNGLKLLADGQSAEEVLKQLVNSDEKSATRQVGIVDATGRSVTFTGDECFDWAGGVAKQNFAAQGNILVDEKTIDAMVKTFETTNGSLAERLLAALLAGDLAGGDSRGKQSAALLVVKENGSYGGYNDRYIDLRVDDHTDPVNELSRLLQLHHLYFEKTKQEDILEIDAALEVEITEILKSNGYAHEDEPFFESLKAYMLTENFDDRIQKNGYIDKKVLEYMRQQ